MFRLQLYCNMVYEKIFFNLSHWLWTRKVFLIKYQWKCNPHVIFIHWCIFLPLLMFNCLRLMNQYKICGQLMVSEKCSVSLFSWCQSWRQIILVFLQPHVAISICWSRPCMHTTYVFLLCKSHKLTSSCEIGHQILVVGDLKIKSIVMTFWQQASSKVVKQFGLSSVTLITYYNTCQNRYLYKWLQSSARIYLRRSDPLPYILYCFHTFFLTHDRMGNR